MQSGPNKSARGHDVDAGPLAIVIAVSLMVSTSNVKRGARVATLSASLLVLAAACGSGTVDPAQVSAGAPTAVATTAPLAAPTASAIPAQALAAPPAVATSIPAPTLAPTTPPAPTLAPAPTSAATAPAATSAPTSAAAAPTAAPTAPIATAAAAAATAQVIQTPTGLPTPVATATTGATAPTAGRGLRPAAGRVLRPGSWPLPGLCRRGRHAPVLRRAGLLHRSGDEPSVRSPQLSPFERPCRQPKQRLHLQQHRHGLHQLQRVHPLLPERPGRQRAVSSRHDPSPARRNRRHRTRPGRARCDRPGLVHEQRSSVLGGWCESG